MGKYDGFMDNIGRTRRAKKRKKSADDGRQDMEYSNRMDSEDDKSNNGNSVAESVHENIVTPEPGPVKPSERGTGKPGTQSMHDNYFYFSFVLDATADVAVVYKRICPMLIRVVDKLEATRNGRSSESRNITMKIGVTTFHDQVSGENDDKFGEQLFTDDFDAVRKRLREMKFWGGDCETGRECINEAQLEGLRRMALQRDREAKWEASCSQILITTSLPLVVNGDEEGYFSFERTGGDFRTKLNLGVRFALNIVYDKSRYDPEFKIVDRNGRVSQEKSGYTVVANIGDILNGTVSGVNQGKPFEDKEDVVAAIVNDLLEHSSLLSIQT